MSHIDELRHSLAGHYRIERELGAGGMATVYLAHDLKHDRDVAIKVLHSDLGAALGAERFLGEIRTTARLQHPHILPLLDSGDADGLLYYVMPFVAGETLRARLERERQLPVADALRIAREVADALAAAHDKGIIHRDVKPENVLLQGGSGQQHALVADFGIALAVQHAADSQRMTQTGLSLGTPQYMSPEQAMGDKTIDARSDIYALGAIAYEMLTGQPPFTGATVQAIVAKVLTEKPTRIRTVRDTVSPQVEAAILTALAKLPADRFQSAGEFALALSGVHTAAQDAPSREGARETTTAARASRWLVTAVGVLAAAAVAFFIGRNTRSGGDAPFSKLGMSTQVTWEPGLEITPAISPDGRQVAYSVGNGTASKIFVRPVAGGRATPLTDDTIAVESFPEWSRDGSRVLYLRGGQAFSAPSGGGAARQEVPRAGGITTATWSPDGRIAYAVGDSLFVQEADGKSRFVASFFQPSMCTWGPRDMIACAAGNVFYLAPGIIFGNVIQNWIVTVDARTGATHVATDSIASHQSPRWSQDGGSLLYVSTRLGLPDVFMVSIGSDGAATSTPRRLTTGLNVASFSLSADDSRIAYAVITTSANLWSQRWAELATRPETPTQATFGEQTIEEFSLSRDGKWVYYDSDLAGNADIYRMPLPSGVPERLTSTIGEEFAPAVSPDGNEVAFHTMRGGSRDVMLLRLDGSPVTAVAGTSKQELLARWSPDGRSLSYGELAQQGRIWLTRRSGDGAWEPSRQVADGWFSQWSGDGRYLSLTTALFGGALAVVNVDSGVPRVLYDLTQPGAPTAEMSVWSSDGRTLFFKSHSATGAAAIWSVPFAGGAPRKLMDLGDARLRADRFVIRVANGRLYYPLIDRQANVWVMESAR